MAVVTALVGLFNEMPTKVLFPNYLEHGANKKLT